MEYLGRYRSPLGTILMSGDDTSLTGLWFEGERYSEELLSRTCGEKDLPVFEVARRWLDTYFEGIEPDFTPPLRFTGTEFGNRVCSLLLEVPYGRTCTYGDIARRIAEESGRPRMSAQAVGGAVGRNRISIMVPCHRVVGSDGGLTGYAGGLERKRRLLELEKGGTSGILDRDIGPVSVL